MKFTSWWFPNWRCSMIQPDLNLLSCFLSSYFTNIFLVFQKCFQMSYYQFFFLPLNIFLCPYVCFIAHMPALVYLKYQSSSTELKQKKSCYCVCLTQQKFDCCMNSYNPQEILSIILFHISHEEKSPPTLLHHSSLHEHPLLFNSGNVTGIYLPCFTTLSITFLFLICKPHLPLQCLNS